MERKLLIIACSSRKRRFQSHQPAIDVYDGVVYRVIRKAKRARALENLDIMILSAEYGLIDSVTSIEYYDRRMTSHRALELRDQVESMVRHKVASIRYEEIYVDLGKAYLTALRPSAFIDPKTKVIIASGKIGQRLKQLKAWLS